MINLEKKIKGQIRIDQDRLSIFQLINLILTYHYLFQKQMQFVAEELKQTLWSKLSVVYTLYATNEDEISTLSVEEFLSDVLKEVTQMQKDYVTKNMFRLDVDGNGSVSFIELGNFLFKRHCGEMSLQKKHRDGKMSHGIQRTMNAAQFNILLNDAYKFLGVPAPRDVTDYIFADTDTDKDGLITYVQYFQEVIQKYVCKPANYSLSKSERFFSEPKEEKVLLVIVPPLEQKVEQKGPERNSKLRRHFWQNLRRLYDAYVQGRSLNLNDIELNGLLYSIVGNLSYSEYSYISSGLLRLTFKTIEFQFFVEYFIFLMAEIGLGRFSRNYPAGKKTLKWEEFVILLKNTFSFLRLAQFKNTILFKIFVKIDKNQDGLITFDDYLDWVIRFLAVLHYYGSEFWVEEDDWEVNKEDAYDALPNEPKSKHYIRFTFSDYTFAKQVRLRVYELLVKYDFDQNQEFDKEQIHAALIELFKQNKYQLEYVTRNVFRYDRDGDKSVTYDQLTNFCVELHFGQMAIQRLHRKNRYSKGKARVMNRNQFDMTLNYVLNNIGLVASPGIISLLFKEIDLDGDGWIPYEVYFLFLRHYFGSLSIGRLETLNIKKKISEAPVLSQDQKFWLELQSLSQYDRFSRLIIEQLRKILINYDYNHNLLFEINEIQDILEKVFSLDENQVSYLMFNFFNFDKSKNNVTGITFEELIYIILSIYFIEIIFKRRYQYVISTVWISKKISLENFILLITDACFFLKMRPTKEDLTWIFHQLDTDHDGFITFQQYAYFIRKYLGNNIDFTIKKPIIKIDVPNVSVIQYNFVNAMWDELKRYFDKYDQGAKGFLNHRELKAFVVEILNETTERELNYIFWNLFRVDMDQDQTIQFPQFAPFILSHAGEISLQRFHRNQQKGKSTLSEQELSIVFGNAYNFLASIPKEKVAINKIFVRIQQNRAVSYSGLLNWIHNCLSAKYKKP